MTTSSTGRLYHFLTPRERLPLLIAATGRADAVEQRRLQTSSPKEKFKSSDYCAHAEALNEAAHYHLLTLLDLGMEFWQWWWLWMTRSLRNQAKHGSSRDRRAKAKADKAL